MADLTLIRQARAQRGITLEELATEAGISASALTDIELARRTPHVTTLAKVCRVLDVDLGLAYADIAKHLNGERESA